MTGSTEAVADAMSRACLRAPAMTREEDPDERALAEALCEELGLEAVLLTPTCTMANQIAVRLHLPSGGLLASNDLAHVVTVEARATSLTGVTRASLASEHGHPTPMAVRSFLAESNGTPGGALVWLENTHMLAAGSVMPDEWQAAISEHCRGAGVAVHLDGSRLWNAAAASRSSMAKLATGIDTVAISLNKALGAPLGSVLAGSRALIEEADRWRNALGGEWRPVGPIAAGALAAFRGDWRARLERDLELTHRLAEAICERFGDAFIMPVETNLIFVNRPLDDAKAYRTELERLGVRTTFIAPTTVRLALHGGISADAVTTIVEAMAEAEDTCVRSPS
jgi:threonine aldolase